MRTILTLCVVLLAASPCAAAEKITDPHEKEVVSDCTRDALRYCAKEIPQGRASIIDCMVANKAKLEDKCRRHLW